MESLQNIWYGRQIENHEKNIKAEFVWRGNSKKTISFDKTNLINFFSGFQMFYRFSGTAESRYKEQSLWWTQYPPFLRQDTMTFN